MTNRTNLSACSIIAVFLLGMVTIAGGRTVYVDDDAPADFSNIQDAIDNSSHGDIIVVNPGTYTGDGNRDIDFKGKAITVNSIDPNDPDIIAGTIIDCNGTEDEQHRGFYFHNNEGPGSMIMGLTITEGYASFGGGVYCNSSDPTISNCTFSRNSARWGAGMGNERNSNPTLIRCTFKENLAIINGGGIRNHNSSPNILDCLFIANKAQYGGAIHNENIGSRPIFTWCIFISNTATRFGGAIRNHTSSPTVLNCLIIANQAQYGAGVHNENSSSNPTLINCTFSSNSAIRWGGGLANNNSRPILSNCILWANSDNGGLDESAQIHGGFPDVNYCCIQGWPRNLGGIGNINADPWFVQPGYRDANGVWIDGDYHLHQGSPCINVGDNSTVPLSSLTDFDGNPRIAGDTVDMGVYEF